MINIILFIVKIVGIMLAVIIGLILLALISILFIPIRYSVNGEIHTVLDSAKVKCKVRWLFGLIRLNLNFESMKLDWSGYVLCVQLNKDKKKTKKLKAQKKKQKKKKYKNNKQKNSESKINTECEEHIEKSEAEILVKADDEKTQCSKNDIAELEKEKIKKPKSKNPKNKKDKKKQKKKDKKKDKKKFNILHTIKKICDTIKSLIEKKEKIQELYYMEVHQYAIKKIKLQIIYILKKLRPKKIKIDAKIGFEDPSMTGKFLGIMGVLYPFYGETCCVVPEFNDKVYDGIIFIKGKIRIYPFIVVLFRLIIDKKIRETYKNLKEVKL